MENDKLEEKNGIKVYLEKKLEVEKRLEKYIIKEKLKKDNLLFKQKEKMDNINENKIKNIIFSSLLFYIFFIVLKRREKKRKALKKGKHREKNKININYIIIMIYFIQIVLSNNNINFSNITLKINGIGDKYILDRYGNNFPGENYPDIIYINGENKSTILF